MVVAARRLYSRRQFLLGAVALAGSAVLAACGGTGAPPPASGANQNCVPIDQRIAYDNAQIQALRAQKPKTTNQMKQINNNIAYWQQDAAYFKQQAKQFGCP